jgi:hypothetical protein
MKKALEMRSRIQAGGVVRLKGVNGASEFGLGRFACGVEIGLLRDTRPRLPPKPLRVERPCDDVAQRAGTRNEALTGHLLALRLNPLQAIPKPPRHHHREVRVVHLVVGIPILAFRLRPEKLRVILLIVLPEPGAGALKAAVLAQDQHLMGELSVSLHTALFAGIQPHHPVRQRR